MPSNNVENILYGILTGDGSGIQKPASRVEELLYAIYQNGGGGGGGGTTNYESLHNKPKLNGVTLQGDHSLDYYAPDETAEPLDEGDEQELLNILDD